ncbi:MAG: transporter substrate-binding domain-containing protein [Clostridia bacterium]|nr:transporter substrate-binding domain-containing protein [Clostridia bacterium]
MKKLVSLTLALMLALLAVPVMIGNEESVLAFTAFVGTAICEEAETFSGRGSAWVTDRPVFGILSYCNADEAEVRKLVTSRLIYNRLLQDSGYVAFDVTEGYDLRFDDLSEAYVQAFRDSMEIKFFDSLNAMIMALKSGEVDAIFVHNVVADYLCARDEALFYINHFAVPDADASALTRRLVENGFHSDEFTFMLMEGNEALRDEINRALNAMENEGVLAALEATLNAAGEEPVPIEIEKIEGADTIRVGVTGDLPPFDYISEAGVPAGYNTAILAEIGKRIRKNIELVNIDAGGRALALSSGMVDVVFWNRSQSVYTENGTYEAGEDAMRREIIALGMDPEKTEKALNLIESVFTYDESVTMDQPEGTIITIPFFSSIMTNVQIKK